MPKNTCSPGGGDTGYGNFRTWNLAGGSMLLEGGVSFEVLKSGPSPHFLCGGSVRLTD